MAAEAHQGQHTPPPTESSPLISKDYRHGPGSSHPYDGDVESLYSGRSIDSQLFIPHIGERLPYNDYTTIDWLHDLVKDSARHRSIHLQAHTDGYGTPALLAKFEAWWDAAQGWVAAFLIGAFTACVAFVVDVSVATVADWKEGYCVSKPWMDRMSCCPPSTKGEGSCEGWRDWASDGEDSMAAYIVYVGVALLFGLLAGSVTMTTRTNLPSVGAEEVVITGKGKGCDSQSDQFTETSMGKTMYMAAGSGIPEIKTILSGFVIPHFLDLKVMVVKAVGATFAVATGMCLGKEGPFVHISACVGYLVSRCFPKYRGSERKMREMLSVACSAGLSVAFGAPIGGVLFSYEVRGL